MPGKLRMSISTKFIGCEVTDEVNLPDDWSTMTDAQKDTWVSEEFDTFLGNNTDMSHQIEEIE